MKLYTSISLLIALIFCAPTHAQTIFPPFGKAEKQLIQMISEKKAEHKLEFAFDIHKVLLHKKSKLIWTIIRNYPHKSQFIKALWNIPLMVSLGSIVWQSVINVLPWQKNNYHEITSARFIHNLLQAKAIDLAELFTTVVNAQRPDPDVETILKELKQRGYTLHIASNIGTQIFIKLKEQLTVLGQNIFVYFDKDAEGMEGKTVDCCKNRVEKPDPEYYKQYLDLYDPDRSKLIIFVDDKLVNILPAVAQGFLGIHFKNPAQFRHDLMSLGIL